MERFSTQNALNMTDYSLLYLAFMCVSILTSSKSERNEIKSKYNEINPKSENFKYI